MSAPSDGPGIREALWGWAIWGVVAGTVFVTYARLPARDFYNVTGTGVWSGAARLLVLTGWPISLAAVALLAVAADRLLAADLDRGARRTVRTAAIAATVLCATIAVPFASPFGMGPASTLVKRSSSSRP